ncbi:MAG TPA: 4-phosphoerythronate dehydrogenase, partial [Bacteroidota bacterium]|nr:4-phosphoerythronate dehydrogenase [Bacteroidota bacterium]
VGTATIGTDHIDTDFLSSQGIGFANAPGCNANSVKEYVLAALLVLAAKDGNPLRGRTLGVVGLGHIGSRVAEMGRALGMTVHANDPPLARSTHRAEMLPLDALMQSDVVTLHVPLTREGPDATYRLFDRRRIGALKKGAILINTSRGAVVEGEALREALRSGHLGAAILDVWEGEPSISEDLLRLSALATPHIAGYSLDGKVNAVVQIRRALEGYFSQPSDWHPQLPPPDVGRIRLADGGDTERLLSGAVRRCYDIELDDRQMRMMLQTKQESRGRYFMGLRSGYRTRREFSAFDLEIPSGNDELHHALQSVGFNRIRQLP